MTPDELRALLSKMTNAEFVDREVFGRRPWIFESDQSHLDWQNSVASLLKIRAADVKIVGSAATGYSLSPQKPGRPFQAISSDSTITSDIDIAILDWKLFERAWDTIVFHDRRGILRGSEDSRMKLRTDLYWGFISRMVIPPNTDAARMFLSVEAEAGRIPPIRGYPIRFRVYRRIEDLKGYHLSSLRSLRAAIELT